MTKKEQKRRIEIIKELCQLSKDSWRSARREDYEPLERELKKLNEKLIKSYFLK